MTVYLCIALKEDLGLTQKLPPRAQFPRAKTIHPSLHLMKHPALATLFGLRAFCPEGFLCFEAGFSSFVELTPCNIVMSGSAPQAMRQGYAPRPQFPTESFFRSHI